MWEALLLVHARRKRVLAEEHRPILFTSKNPHSVNTFLVYGKVAGTWRYDNGKVDVEPFAPLAAAAEREVPPITPRPRAFWSKSTTAVTGPTWRRCSRSSSKTW